MNYYIASDHVGYRLKNKIITHFKGKAMILKDVGTFSEERVDYPDYAIKLAKKIKKDDLGILICGTGIGMSIMANRFRHIRAAECTNIYMTEMSVKHNNANVLCLGAKIVHLRLAKLMVSIFLKSKFEGGRHKKRLEKLKFSFK